MKRFALTSALLALVFAALPAGAVAICNGVWSGPSVIAGDLLVPAGATCFLGPTNTVSGNTTVRGAIDAVGTTFAKNVTADHATTVQLVDVSIGGNFVADHTSTGPNAICMSVVTGNLTVQQSLPGVVWSVGGECGTAGAATADCDALVGEGSCNPCFLADCGNDVGKNLSFNNNLGPGEIVDNLVGGNLDCKNNVPPPVVLDNDVHGTSKGQCASNSPT